MGIPFGVGLRQYDARVVSDATAVHTGDETIVQQHLKDEVDVNTIVRRFGLVQELPRWHREGVYGDFTGIEDFDSAIAKIESVRGAFMELAPEVRERFQNDPGELVRYASSVSEDEFDRTISGLAPEAPPEPAAPAPEPPAPVVDNET